MQPYSYGIFRRAHYFRREKPLWFPGFWFGTRQWGSKFAGFRTIR
jgi:hypothetical protein